MKHFKKLVVNIEENIPEYMEGRIRIAYVKALCEDGSETIIPKNFKDAIFYSQKGITDYLLTEYQINNDIIEFRL